MVSCHQPTIRKQSFNIGWTRWGSQVSTDNFQEGFGNLVICFWCLFKVLPKPKILKFEIFCFNFLKNYFFLNYFNYENTSDTSTPQVALASIFQQDHQRWISTVDKLQVVWQMDRLSNWVDTRRNIFSCYTLGPFRGHF